MKDPQSASPARIEEPASTKQEEWRSFLFLTIFMAPALAVAIVGSYGFAIWMYQLVTGQLPSG